MKLKENNKSGFIQLPILITIIVGVLILAGAGYVSVKQYQSFQEAQVVAETQQKALEQAQTEIEKLKTESETAKQKQIILEKTIADEAKTSADPSISASEISPYLTGVVNITCKDSSGSGSLWNLDSEKVVVTNAHVIKTPFYSSYNKQYYCVVWVENLNGDFEANYAVFPYSKWNWNAETDIAVMKLIEHFYPDGNPLPDELQKPISQMNYKISALQKCPIQMTVGSHVAVIGYPAFGMQDILGGRGTEAARITTNGVVSGYDKTVTPPYGKLPYPNYYVSAKIDSGSSGGIAIAKMSSGLCILGIPTWLNVGEYETQGLVQDMNNIQTKNEF